MRLPSPGFLVGLLGAAICGRAEVVLAPPFQDHMVLQRDRALPVWGWAAPGERVRVTLGESGPVQTTAGGAGTWRVLLAPRPANATPSELLVEGENRLVVRDVLIGEVWLCSGQSNMEFRLKLAAGAAEDIAQADFPKIRQLKISRHPAEEPCEQMEALWSVCSPGTAGEFTAVGFYFARALWRTLQVPIGIIHSAHGNSPIESWMSREALANSPEFSVVRERWASVLAGYPAARLRYEAALAHWEAAAANAHATHQRAPMRPSMPIGPGHHQSPSSLFNGMIRPLVPFAVRGFLWYQGEANARRASEYTRLFQTQIAHWRRDFAAPDAPFFWVQLPALGHMPPTTSEIDWVNLRAAQTSALALPHTAQAIALDVGDDADIHPKRKREVGERLARLARRRVYGEDIVDGGPEFQRAVARDGRVQLHFGRVAGGLQGHGELRSAFELAGDDGRFVACDTAAIEGRDVVALQAAGVAEPRMVRYAWQANPRAWLGNGDELPAAPFSEYVR